MCVNLLIFAGKIESGLSANPRKEFPYFLLNLKLLRIQGEIQPLGNVWLPLHELIWSLPNPRRRRSRRHVENTPMHEECWVYRFRNRASHWCSCGDLEPG